MSEPNRQRRRTGREPRMFDNSVSSPCVSVCTLSREGICEGCYRNQDEIRDWMIMSRDEKLDCLVRCAERMHAQFD